MNGAGMISKPRTRVNAAFLTICPLGSPRPFFVERPVDALQDRRHVGAGAAAGIEHIDVVGGEAIGDRIFPQGLVHARHHVGDDLVGVYQTPSSLRSAGSKASRNGS